MRKKTGPFLQWESSFNQTSMGNTAKIGATKAVQYGTEQKLWINRKKSRNYFRGEK